MNSLNISFIIGKFALGGVTRNTINISNALIEKGHNVTLVVLHGEEISYKTLDLSSKVQVRILARKRTLFNGFSLFTLISFLKNSPQDLVISAVEYVNVLTLVANALSNSKAKVITTTRTDLRIEYTKNFKIIHLIEKPLAKWLYRYAYKNVAVSKGVADSIKEELGLSKPVEVIYNPAARESLFNDKLIRDYIDKPKKFKFISCGRLTKQKNFPFLLECFAELNQKYSNIELEILGDGEEEEKLKRKIHELGIGNSCRLLGRVLNPEEYFQVAQCFVLTSDWEGFGNVIVEALASGLFVISTDCPSGPREVLSDNNFGLLSSIGNKESFVANMEKVYLEYASFHKSEVDRISRAREFTPAKISEQYLAL